VKFAITKIMLCNLAADEMPYLTADDMAVRLNDSRSVEVGQAANPT
jgi:hypothetical protein